MNVEQLSRQFFTFQEDCREYYDNLTSQMKEDIILEPDDSYYVDYFNTKDGACLEGELLKLKKESILIHDVKTNKAIHIKFDQLTLPDQLTVLDLYEQNQ